MNPFILGQVGTSFESYNIRTSTFITKSEYLVRTLRCLAVSSFSNIDCLFLVSVVLLHLPETFPGTYYRSYYFLQPSLQKNTVIQNINQSAND